MIILELKSMIKVKQLDQSIALHFKSKEDVGQILSRMAAADGLSFHVLSSSKIRKGFIARGLQIRTTTRGIKLKVMEYGKQAKEGLALDLQKRRRAAEELKKRRVLCTLLMSRP